ncbi:MAG: RHS repeat-associated core domain-containing protein [Acidobacteriia bacterium]|nr:RHS repeat-associated core domain-containing protein [Terriglobia bacterium]
MFSGTDFDSVQLNNGNLHVEIPLWSLKGRGGLPVTFKYVYDNKGWYLDTHCVHGGAYCTDTVKPNPGHAMNWRLAGPLNYVFGHKAPQVYCSGIGVSEPAHSYTMEEPNGTKHHFLPDPEGICWAPLGTKLYADDGSGWRLHVDSTSAQVLYAVSKDGTVVNPTYNPNNQWAGPGLALQDTNGNQIIQAYGSTNFTDTMGRTLPGVGNPSYGLSYTDSSGNPQTIQVITQTVSIQTNQCRYSGSDACNEDSGGWLAPHQIILPDNLTYTINYPTSPSYGEPVSITVPTGAQMSYTWATGDVGGHKVATRTETVNGSSYTWDYTAYTDPAGNATVPTCSFLGNYGDGGGNPICYISQMQYYQGTPTSGTLVKTVHTDFSTPDAAGILPTRETTTWNPQNLVTKTETDYDNVTTVDGAGQVTLTVRVNNPTYKREYAYSTGGPGGLVRKTQFDYLHVSTSTYRDLNMLDLTTDKIVYDSSGTNIVARTNYAYDGSVLTSTSSTPAPNHDYTNFGSGFLTRGNLTKSSRGLLSGGAWNYLDTNNTYDDLGNILSTKDPGLHTTSYSYADNWADANCTLGSNTFAYLTQTTDALTHRTKRSYFRCTGLTASTQDENDLVNSRAGTTFTYDLLNRPLAINYPDGGQATQSYVDVVPLSVTQTKLVDSTLGLSTQHTTVFDDLGRPKQTQMRDPDCTSSLAYIDHAYGYDTSPPPAGTPAGRFVTVSNPYCSDGSSTGISKTRYDVLDRVVRVIPQDGSDTSDNVSTTYSANGLNFCTTVTDQAGRSRQSCSDALGRMTRVWEDPGLSPHLNYETDYVYDTLDNLTSVTQKGSNVGNARTRSFTYDSLSRLTCAANPEVTPGLSAVTPASCPATYGSGAYTNGTIGYSYDADSNLVSKTAPAPNQTSTSSTVLTSYSYDAVHRLTQKSYTGGPSTPTVKYAYDGTSLTCTPAPPTLSDSNKFNNRTAMCDGSGASSWSHDEMGRTKIASRLTTGATTTYTRSFTYSYNKDGSLATLLYPTSHQLTYTPNGSGGYTAGRTVSVKNIALSENYVTNASYAPQGTLKALTHGSSILGGFSYNSRLQPIQLVYTTGTMPDLTTSSCPPTAGNIMHRAYHFGLTSNDNGNVLSIDNCRDTNRTQNFDYDSLNRIVDAYTTGSNWGETYTTDAWGNLTNIASYGTKTGHETLNLAPASIKNQLNGLCNDAAGDLVLNTGNCPTGVFTPTFTYDGENRLVSTAGWTYGYDGDGNRVSKCNSCGTSSGGTLYWSGSGTDPLVETNLAGALQNEYVFFNGKRVVRRDSSNNINYYMADHLGSADVVTAALGTIKDESDYYPYGGEIIITNTLPQNYKFTGKERDSESGLDDFGARFYSSSIGRFMQVDEFTGGPIDVLDPSPSSAGPLPYADIFNPQSLNKYAYTYNNPLRYIDPNGHDAWDIVKGSGETVIGFGAVVVGAASSEVGVGVPIALGGVALMGKGAIDLGKGIDPKLDTKDAEAGVQVVTGKNGLPDPVGVIGTAVTGDIQKGAKAADTVNKVADAGKAVKDAVKDPSKVGEAAKKVSSAVKAVTQVVNGAKQYVTVPPPPPPPPAPKCTSDGKCH